MTRRAADALCVFRIHVARLRTEAGPFLLAALGFPAVMYMFASAVGDQAGQGTSDQHRLRFLAGSIVFSVSMTAVSWLGYLLLAAEAMGYRTAPMMEFSAAGVQELLGLPAHVTIPALIAIGKGDEAGWPHHRHSVERITRFV